MTRDQLLAFARACEEHARSCKDPEAVFDLRDEALSRARQRAVLDE